MADERPSPTEPPKEQPAGRVKHDASGRAIWEWAADTGRQALDSTSRLLKRLELPGLTLEEDVKKKDEDEPPPPPPKPTFGGPAVTDPQAGRGKSFNPYENRNPPRRAAAPAATPAGKPATRPPTGTRPAAKPGSVVLPPKKKPGFFARLFGRG